MEKKSIVRIQNISKTYQAENGEVEALKGINFDVKEGEFISIIGQVDVVNLHYYQ